MILFANFGSTYASRNVEFLWWSPVHFSHVYWRDLLRCAYILPVHRPTWSEFDQNSNNCLRMVSSRCGNREPYQLKTNNPENVFCGVCILSSSSDAILVGHKWAASWENLIMPYAKNKGTGQPAHPRSLISAFVVRYLNSIIPLLAKAEISRP